MADYTTILADVKIALGITGTYQDNTIQQYIDEVKELLVDGGVDESIVNSVVSKGIISRGVADLWNYGAGEGKLSSYFWQRATQLSLKSTGETPEAIAKLDARVTDLENRVDEHDKVLEDVLVIEGDN